jgi:hypothetical protein
VALHFSVSGKRIVRYPEGLDHREQFSFDGAARRRMSRSTRISGDAKTRATEAGEEQFSHQFWGGSPQSQPR